MGALVDKPSSCRQRFRGSARRWIVAKAVVRQAVIRMSKASVRV
jgi:hypothetical protein